MRRVYDDCMYSLKSEEINEIIWSIEPKEVSEYDYGMRRAQTNLIVKEILNNVSNIKLGKDVNTSGIGNNYCHELIYIGNPEEEQIFGLIHCTNDMYGGVICWVSDVDESRNTPSRKIVGC